MTALVAPQTRALGFTELDVKFVQELLRTGEVAIAQQYCGMTNDDATLLLNATNFETLLRREIGRVFTKVLIPKALARLREYAEKGEKPDRGQLDAVKTILDRAGLIAPKASEPDKHNLELEDMTTAQLHEYITRGEQVIASRLAPNTQPLDPQVIEVLS